MIYRPKQCGEPGRILATFSTKSLNTLAKLFSTASFASINMPLMEVAKKLNRTPTPAETEQFHEWKEVWKRETGMHSNISIMAKHWAYQRIIGMGEKAVTLMLTDMQTEINHWFWALTSITGANPIGEDIAGYVEAMTNAWLTWGKENEYI